MPGGSRRVVECSVPKQAPMVLRDAVLGSGLVVERRARGVGGGAGAGGNNAGG